MKKLRFCLVTGLAFAAAQVASEQIIIETDDTAAFIRCTDLGGNAACEMIFEDANRLYDCIAFDLDGKPIATTKATGSNALFRDIQFETIADVKCR